MANEKNKGIAPDLNEQELRALAEKQAAAIEEKDGIIKAQQETVEDLMEKLNQSEDRRKTGVVTLKHGKTTYKVVGVKVPTLDFAKAIGANSIPSEELHKHPKLVELYVNKGIGFLVPVEE
jgi:hypothetical protein